VHVLRQIHRALKPKGLLLDVHPVGDDFPVLAGERGIGFVDIRKFRAILEAMNACVEQTVAEGLFEEVRELRRHVAERYNNATEVLEEADGWENLRLPPAVRRRLQETDATPIEFIDTVRYRLLGKREEVPTSRSA
jgi:SAM-dependent methyltransferase